MKRTLFVLVLLAVLPAAALLAQQPAPPPDPTAPTSTGQPAAAQAPPQDFVPVTALPPQAEQLPAAPLVIGAYAVVWVALLAYVWMLWRRMTKLERELADLQRRIQKH